MIWQRSMLGLSLLGIVIAVILLFRYGGSVDSQMDSPTRQPPRTQQECEAAGGTWDRFGLLIKEECNLPTADAGKPCKDASECESLCVAQTGIKPGTPVTGECFQWTITRGWCLNLAENGQVKEELCVD